MNKLIISIVFLLCFQGEALGQVSLVLHEAISKTIEIENEHQYTVDLQKGDHALIGVMQSGIDVVLETYKVNGDLMDKFDSQNGSNGNEIVLVDADQSGVYLIKVITLGERKKERSGSYTIELLGVSDSITSHLDLCFESIGNRTGLPGFFISIVDSEKVIYSSGQGFANIEKQIPYTINTIQQIESISKTFIGLSIMMLVEQELLDLEESINTYLPFEVSHPQFPNTPITLRQLATHTASIADRPEADMPFWMENKEVFIRNRDKYMHKSIRKELEGVKDNEEISMEEFLKAYFIPKGKYYSKKNYLKPEPGRQWLYSNVGATLAAYIVQTVSKQTYSDFVEDNILKPLELNNTTWGYNPEAAAINAVKYDGGKTEYPRRNSATYPDGGIYSSTADLSKYLIEWIGGRSGLGQLLKEASFAEIMKVNFEETQGQFKGIKNGLFWWIFKGNRMGHNGGNYGVNANMFFYPDLGIGYTSLENMMLNESEVGTIQSAHIKLLLGRYANRFASK